jgi:DNA-binding transcriptional MocR family regulator
VPSWGASGINVWVPVADETAVLARLRDAGYAVAPGSRYRIAAPPGIRVTAGTVPLADIEPLADAIAASVLRSWSGPGLSA